MLVENVFICNGKTYNYKLYYNNYKCMLFLLLLINLQRGKKPVLISHTTIDPHGDEGFVQKAPVTVTSSILQRLELYISIWVVDKVSMFV